MTDMAFGVFYFEGSNDLGRFQQRLSTILTWYNLYVISCDNDNFISWDRLKGALAVAALLEVYFSA